MWQKMSDGTPRRNWPRRASSTRSGSGSAARTTQTTRRKPYTRQRGSAKKRRLVCESRSNYQRAIPSYPTSRTTNRERRTSSGKSENDPTLSRRKLEVTAPLEGAEKDYRLVPEPLE